eukprot:3491783-Rhodomonas_salina.2
MGINRDRADRGICLLLRDPGCLLWRRLRTLVGGRCLPWLRGLRLREGNERESARKFGREITAAEPLGAGCCWGIRGCAALGAVLLVYCPALPLLEYCPCTSDVLVALFPHGHLATSAQ